MGDDAGSERLTFGKLLGVSVGAATVWSLALYSLTELSSWMLFYR